MFDCLGFVVQQVKELEEGQVSSIHPVFVFVLLLTFVHCLAKPACLGISWTVAVVMMSLHCNISLSVIMPTCVCTHRLNHSQGIHTQRCYHALKSMQT